MKKMFKLFISLVVLMVVFIATLSAQDVDSSKVNRVTELGAPTTLFNNYPYALNRSIGNDAFWFSKTTIESYEAIGRIEDYRRKRNTEMIIGASVGAVGLAGIFYSVNMPTPVKQVNNPALDDEANRKRRDRRIVGATSTAVAAVGAVIFARAFRWENRIKAEINLTTLRLEYKLFNRREYFQGEKIKRLKRSNVLYPRYR
jgi:hypothetical protein